MIQTEACLRQGLLLRTVVEDAADPCIGRAPEAQARQRLIVPTGNQHRLVCEAAGHIERQTEEIGTHDDGIPLARALAKGLEQPYIAGGEDPDLEATLAAERPYLRILIWMVAVIVIGGFVLGFIGAILDVPIT